MTGRCTRWERCLPGSGGRLKVLNCNLHSFQLFEIIQVLDSKSWVRCASGNVSHYKTFFLFFLFVFSIYWHTYETLGTSYRRGGNKNIKIIKQKRPFLSAGSYKWAGLVEVSCQAVGYSKPFIVCSDHKLVLWPMFREGVQKKTFFLVDLSQMWVGGVADFQTRSKPLKTPPNRPFRPEFHLSFSQISQKSWGQWENRFGRDLPKKRYFCWGLP